MVCRWRPRLLGIRAVVTLSLLLAIGEGRRIKRSKLKRDALQHMKANESNQDSVGKLHDDETDLRCCCDTDLGVEDAVCQYVKPRYSWGNPKCPEANLGRGRSQTHHVERHAGFSSRCDLTPAAIRAIVPEEMSVARKQCIVQKEVDAKYFPPEKFSHFAIRKGVPSIPGIGDLYTAIEEIQIVEVGLEMVIERKDDNTFRFAIQGPQGENSKATAKVWIKNFEIYLPDSSADNVVKALAWGEHVLGTIFTLGFAGKNYGKMDNIPGAVEFSMSGDIRLDKDGEWKVVASTEKHYADVTFGTGMLQSLYELFLNSFGGVDKAFYDAIWPLIQTLIPAAAAKAFQTVSMDSGKLKHVFTVKARCNKIVNSAGLAGKPTCPSQLLDLDISDTVELRIRPEPIIKDLLEQKFFVVPAVEEIFKNVANVYENQQSVFDGTQGSVRVGFQIENGGISVSASPTISLPINLLQSVAGPTVPINNYLLSSGEESQVVGGPVSLKDGIFKLESMHIGPIVVPIGAKTEDFLEISVDCEGFEVEVEDDGGQPDGFIFDKTSPLSLHAPGIDVVASRESVNIKPRAGHSEALNAELAERFVRQILHNTSIGLMKPTSVRNKSDATAADGKVPPQFQPKFVSMKKPIDLNGVLEKGIDLEVKVDLASIKKSTDQSDFVEVAVHTTINGQLTLGSSLWHGLVESKDPDLGYLGLTIAGHYGPLESGGKPHQKALAVLNCGILEIFDATHARTAGEYPSSPQLSLDLRKKDEDFWKYMRNTKALSNGQLCVHLDTTGSAWWKDDEFLCGPSDDVSGLLRAVEIQSARLESANSLWRTEKACSPGPNGKLPTCLGNPDGTWFEKFDPYKASTWFPGRPPPTDATAVQSPMAAWRLAG